MQKTKSLPTFSYEVIQYSTIGTNLLSPPQKPSPHPPPILLPPSPGLSTDLQLNIIGLTTQWAYYGLLRVNSWACFKAQCAWFVQQQQYKNGGDVEPHHFLGDFQH